MVERNRELPARRFDHARRLVGRRVVDDDNGVARREGLPREVLEAFGEQPGAVVRGDDDGDRHACAALMRPMGNAATMRRT